MTTSARWHLGIDACNIRQGGGQTHLVQLLAASEPTLSGLRRVTVWCGQATARVLPSRPWLEVQTRPWMDGALPTRVWGQQHLLPSLVREAGCDVLFSPGGTVPRRCGLPLITMSQNMLPFEAREARRFGTLHPMRLKMWLLRQSQSRSFRRADGIVFLTGYARSVIGAFLGGLPARTALVPHGIEPRFRQAPREQPPLSAFNAQRPFKLLYVSIAMPYKHQLEVAEAVAGLRASGWPVEVRFIGASWGRYGKTLRRRLTRLDPSGRFLHWHGEEPFDTVSNCYKQADAFVFASSCENLPNIMIEAMAAGLPIASSMRGPMPEVLGEAGCYFDPDSVQSIAEALQRLMADDALRAKLAQDAWDRASGYSWAKCARQTLDFIADTLQAKGVA